MLLSKRQRIQCPDDARWEKYIRRRYLQRPPHHSRNVSIFANFLSFDGRNKKPRKKSSKFDNLQRVKREQATTRNEANSLNNKKFLSSFSAFLLSSLARDLIIRETHSNNNGEAENETETPKSSEDDENNSEESSSNDTNNVDTSNSQLIKWTAEDLVAIDDGEEKVYEELCYVTISSSFPSEVFMAFPYFCSRSLLFFFVI